MAMNHVLGCSEKEVIAAAVPFSHIAGLMYPLLSIYFNITIVLLERFIPLRFLSGGREIQSNILLFSALYVLCHIAA